MVTFHFLRISPMMKKLLLLCVVSVFVLTGTSFAQWSSDTTKNTAVCTAVLNQQNPQICSDGADGAIIVWEDFRAGNWDIYAQKLNAAGVPQWTKDGVNICVSTADQTSPVICSDGAGGAYVAFKDSRNAANGINIYSQHINSNGTMAYGAAGSGIAVAAMASQPNNLAICIDGNGSAFVAWEDNRSSLAAATRPDIWMNKLGGNGPQWGAAGVSKVSQKLGQKSPALSPDGSGGCYLFWVHDSLPAASIMGNRMNAGGGLLWGGGGPGNQVFGVTTGITNPSRNPQLATDGNEVCVVWEEYNNSNTSNGWNILCTKMKNDGTNLWNTLISASEVSGDISGDQTNPVVFSDDSTAFGTNGMMVVYQSYIGSNDIVMTRVEGDGLTRKPAPPYQLYAVCNQPYDQTLPKAVKTGTGELLIVWNDTRSNNGTSSYSSIYAQRCDKTPSRFLGPAGTTWGSPVSNIVNSNADQVALTTRTNGGIAAWRDNRNGNNDIYAQVIFRDGTLPIELMSFSASVIPSGRVLLNWQTASEKNTAGFEIERRFITDPNAPNTFESVGSYATNSSLRAAGNSNTVRSYAFTDQPGKSGAYEYRLIDYSLDGERTVHAPETVNVGDASSAQFSAGVNTPNPVSDKTIIPLTLASDANVTVRISDVLGRTVTTPYNNSLLSSGTHDLQISSNGLSSGSYYIQITITDPQSGNILWSSPKAMLMQVVR
jgi:hypothetical protein